MMRQAKAPLCLVTGGAGFIGSHLVEALLAEGQRVRVIDDLSTGKMANVEPFLDRIDFRKASILDLPAVHSATQGVDYVLHQAALSSVPRSVRDPLPTHRVNTEGTLNVLLAARDAEVRRLVYASSSSVYGDPPVAQKIETLPPMPLSPYAVSKLAAEQYCQVFHRVYGLETVCLRYFNVFGPRQDPQSEYAAVVPRFAAALLESRRPVIYGDGEQSRDFTYVSNVVAANLLALRADGAAGEVFNIATGEKITVNELAAILAQLTNRALEPVHEPKRAGDVAHSLADISKASRILGYVPSVGVRDGLARAVAWYSRQ
jgi:nucleoside-diphosphate-sugar epimerase